MPVATTLSDPVLEWDFAPFTEQVSLQAPDEVPSLKSVMSYEPVFVR